MKDLGKVSVTWITVGKEVETQRLDNFLVKTLKGVPKSRIYRMVQGGEARVNSRRVEPGYRLQAGDKIRIPPVRTASPAKVSAPSAKALQFAPLIQILLEDDGLLVVDKPAGIAVHGGSGISWGVIELLRAQRPAADFLELVHRLDRDTSGILLLAKKRSVLTVLHRQLREGEVDKRYWVLVQGHWSGGKKVVEAPLHKYVTASGERRVSVHAEGRPCRTVFRPLRRWRGCALLEAELGTGRTHQIRVHLNHLGHPIAGDGKYGDFAWNRELAKQGLGRMFLHAKSMTFCHPQTGIETKVEAPLPEELEVFLTALLPIASPKDTLIYSHFDR